MRRRAASCLAAMLLAAGAMAVRPAGAAPAAGHYDAHLCVTLPEQAASCGPALAYLSATALRVRVSDVEYRLALQAKRPAGALRARLMHGAMQIDDFSAPYEWRGRTLQFDDTDKRTRYEVQLGNRPRAE